MSLFHEIAPYLAEFAAALVSVGVIWLIRMVSGYLNIQVSRAQQEALGAAFGRAAKHALARVGTGDSLPKEAIMSAAKAEAVAYIKATMPDTVKALGASEGALASRAEAELRGVLK